MLKIDLTPQQYKELSYTILKDKLYSFILGLFVIVTLLSISVVKFQPQVITSISEGFVNVKRLFTRPSIQPSHTLNIKEVLQSYGGGKDIAVTIPSVTPGVTTTSAPTPTVAPSVTPTATPLAENGQISAIQSGQVTFKGNQYVVQEGDSLASIAQFVYGDSNAWTVIAEANKLSSPDQIEVGMKLKIPKR